MIWRGYCEHVYFTCMRCHQKWPIADMTWKAGLLVCNQRCNDLAIDGSFEYRMAKEAGKETRELQPDPKLVNPVDPLTQLETLPASSGVY